MSDSENDPMRSLLSSFALGPSWARATGASPRETPARKQPEPSNDASRRHQRDDARHGGGARGRDGDSRFSGRGRAGKFADRHESPSRPQDAPPAQGVRVTLVPDAQAVHLIGKEVHQVARVYPLFDVAKILLAERGRCRAIFEASEPHPPLFRGKLDESLFLTREEALRHLWSSELKKQFVEEEVVEVEPPSGNFQLVAKCGLTGMWLGPPNFHAYQVNLRRLHRECFPTMPFAAYAAKVRTERGEEAVNAWLETMKKRARWRLKGDGDEAWIEDRAEAERALANRCFDLAFEETRRAEVLASIPPQNLSASLMTSLKMAGNHARNHPAILIPAVCKAVEAEHLPVFKRQGKLYTGPARPHPLPPGQALAERPGIMVEWIRANKPAKLEGLWKAVLPEGSTAPPAEFAADLFWLLHQGHILLFTDDTLVVQEVRESTPPAAEGTEARSKKKKKKKKPHATELAADQATETPGDSSPSADEATGAEPDDLDTGNPPANDTETASEIAEPEPQADATPADTGEDQLAEAGTLATPETPAETTPAEPPPENLNPDDLSAKNSAGVDDSPTV